LLTLSRILAASLLSVFLTVPLFAQATQPAESPSQSKTLNPDPKAAAFNRQVAKSLRRKHTFTMELARNNVDPLKTAATEQAKHLEELIAAVEEIANANEEGDADRINKAGKNYSALESKSQGMQDRVSAAREEIILMSNNSGVEMKNIAGPFDVAQVEQYLSIRQRAIDAWADVRKTSLANPDGRGVTSAKINATRLTLTTSRYERVVTLKIKASKIRAQAEKSDTPDLHHQLANSLDQVAADLAKNLDQQIELKTQELELIAKQDSLESQAPSLSK
jgi:hypothetical protein